MRKTTCLGLAAMGMTLLGCAHEADLDMSDGAGADADAVVLASFELSNGNTVTMTGLPGFGEILVNEIAPAGKGERFLVEEQPAAGPLELFARLTPAGTPVPQMIYDLARDEERATWLGQREVVDEPAATPFQVDAARLGLPSIVIASGAGSCDSATGAQYFDDHHCDTMGPYGYGATETRCDKTAEPMHNFDSPSPMRHTYTRMAACNGTGRIRHSRETISGFTTVLDELVPPNSIATYVSYRTGLKDVRRARAEVYDPFDGDAYVRLWTRFFDQVTADAP